LGDDEGPVRAVVCERNEITRRDDGTLAARGTGETFEVPAQLVFRSIGYTGLPVADIPFDEKRGLIRNQGGRVIDEHGAHHVGEYVTGWIKRGPSGVIGTNKKDSQDTVSRLLEDAAADRLNQPTSDDIDEFLRSRAQHLVEWDDWQAIDTAETTAGQQSDPQRPRIKLADWEQLREAARAQTRR
jgi:ferredoxin--NADP+ reductase